MIRIRVGSPATTTSCALRFGCHCHFSWRPQAHHEPHPTHPHPRWREEISENGQVYHGIVCFYSSPIGFPTFSDTESCYKRLATSALLCTRCCSKGPHHAFAMFLNPRNTHNSNPPPLPPQPLPFSLTKPPVPASTSSKNIRRSINLVCVDSCLRIHSQSEGSSSRTHRYVLPKCLPKMILLLHLSAIRLSSDCRRPRRVGDTSSSRSRTFLRPLPSPPQRTHLQHLLRHLVAQSRGSLLLPLGSYSTSEANSSTGH